MGNKFRLDEKLKAFSAIKNDLPAKLGAIAVNHFKGSFRDQGFTDNSLSLWKPRKNNTDPGRGILIGKGSGDLKKSVRVKRKSQSQVVIGSDLIYAAVHNFGLKAGRGKGFKMPKRELVGNSHQLIRKSKSKIMSEIKKVFK